MGAERPELDSLELEGVILRPTAVVSGMRQLGLILKDDATGLEYLFRPESGGISLHHELSKAQELARDVAYHRVDKLLGWDVSAPVVPWKLGNNEPGVLRPYWRVVDSLLDYHFNKSQLCANGFTDFWLKVATLDYVCAVIDRFANDVLLVNGEPIIIDSGLSFIDGVDFTYHSSIVRRALRGEEVPEDMLADLNKLNKETLSLVLTPFVGDREIAWVLKRSEEVAREKKVL